MHQHTLKPLVPYQGIVQGHTTASDHEEPEEDNQEQLPGLMNSDPRNTVGNEDRKRHEPQDAGLGLDVCHKLYFGAINIPALAFLSLTHCNNQSESVEL